MFIIRTLLTYLFIGLNVVASKPWLYWLQRKVERGELSAQEGYAKVQPYFTTFGRRCFMLAGARLEVKGLENVPQDQAVLFVANHQSYFDIPALMCGIPKPMGFIAKDNLGKIPFFKQWIIAAGAVLIARGEARKALEAIIQAAKVLKSGHSLVVFPEGTRSMDGQLLEFKAGSLKAAQKGRVAIVPVALSGAGEVLGRKDFFIHGKTITVTVLPMIPVEEVQTAETKLLAEQIRQDIAAVLGQRVEPVYTLTTEKQLEG